MSRFSFSFLLPLALCLSLQARVIVAQPSAPSPDAVSLIPKACERALHKEFCTNLLNSNIDSKNADLKGLAFIALKIAEKNATAVSSFIKDSLEKTNNDVEGDQDQDALSDCRDHYLTAVDLIEESVSALINANGPADVTRFVKAAVADLDACDAGLKDHAGAATEVAKRNRDLRQLLNTALSVAHVAKSSP